MASRVCPKCGHEVVASRFLITHTENGREGEYEYFCQKCKEVIDHLKIII